MSQDDLDLLLTLSLDYFMDFSIDGWLAFLALPKVGLPALFFISFISATLIPTGSEPAVFAYIKLNPHMLWPAILIATAGNVAGGMVDWWMGYGAKLAVFKLRARKRAGQDGGQKAQAKSYKSQRLLKWGRRYGPPLLLFSWLPLIGDPLCAVAGWLRLPWRSCLLYMTIGKFLRYFVVTSILLWIPNQFWLDLWNALF